jgi:formate dehydrogenase
LSQGRTDDEAEGIQFCFAAQGAAMARSGVLHDDPVVRIPAGANGIPAHRPDGQTMPSPEAIDFRPGDLLGSVSARSACAATSSPRHEPMSPRQRRRFLSSTSTCRTPGGHLPAVLAGLPDRTAHREGSEAQAGHHRGNRFCHVDLDAAIAHGMTVAEVTYCNSISVAEHVVMMILARSATTCRPTRPSWTAAGYRRLRIAVI